MKVAKCLYSGVHISSVLRLKKYKMVKIIESEEEYKTITQSVSRKRLIKEKFMINDFRVVWSL